MTASLVFKHHSCMYMFLLIGLSFTTDMNCEMKRYILCTSELVN